jgi:hypothetical protein
MASRDGLLLFKINLGCKSKLWANQELIMMQEVLPKGGIGVVLKTSYEPDTFGCSIVRFCHKHSPAYCAAIKGWQSHVIDNKLDQVPFHWCVYVCIISIHTCVTVHVHHPGGALPQLRCRPKVAWSQDIFQRVPD